MNPKAAVCPAWLATLLKQAGAPVPFRQFMDWVLHHPAHGYYGAGQVQIGPTGDFATSPSLGPDFAALLAQQLVDLLRCFPDDGEPISLVECGPGSGDLAADLQLALVQLAPDLVARCELVLVERSPALRDRQKQRLNQVKGLPLRWCSLDDLVVSPVRGVVLAHELLDAFPVDRLVVHNGCFELQGVTLDSAGQLCWCRLPLPDDLAESIRGLCAAEGQGFQLPPNGVPDGWATEWHSDVPAWFSALSCSITAGALLVIDYAMEASRYYAPRRSDGTLMTYRNGVAGLDPLASPGQQDLTAHLCIDTLNQAAAAHGWRPLEQRRQGEALLALGLAKRLHGLQSLPAGELSVALQRREALLRLVDPAALGEFRWLLYGRGTATEPFRLSAGPGS